MTLQLQFQQDNATFRLFVRSFICSHGTKVKTFNPYATSSQMIQTNVLNFRDITVYCDEGRFAEHYTCTAFWSERSLCAQITVTKTFSMDIYQ